MREAIQYKKHFAAVLLVIILINLILIFFQSRLIVQKYIPISIILTELNSEIDILGSNVTEGHLKNSDSRKIINENLYKADSLINRLKELSNKRVLGVSTLDTGYFSNIDTIQSNLVKIRGLITKENVYSGNLCERCFFNYIYSIRRDISSLNSTFMGNFFSKARMRKFLINTLMIMSLLLAVLWLYITHIEKKRREDYILDIEQRNKNIEKLNRDYVEKQNELKNLLVELDERNEELEKWNKKLVVEQRYKKLLDISPVGVFMIQEGRIVYSNYKLISLLGYEKLDEVYMRHVLDFIHPDYHKLAVSRIGKMLKNPGTEVEPLEEKFVKKDGSYIDAIVVSASVIYMDKPTVQGYVFDITEMLRYEGELKKMNIELLNKQDELIKAKNKAMEADKLKSAFLANMSHEIRTPMNAIVGFTSLLIQKYDSEEDKMFTNIINSSCDHLLNLIDDIIDISKIEAGQLKIIKETFSINDILSTVFLKYDSINNKPSVKLELVIPETYEDVKIHSDKVRLDQILSNLISNAIKYTDAGKVEFGYKLKDESVVEFFVKDTGIGIDKNDVNIIFDRFRRIDIPGDKIYRGAGIGLAIVKSLVDMLGGKISVESELGKGSCFYVSFPV